jgi:glycine/D-amino acid oxidase-like deaminating enzyme
MLFGTKTRKAKRLPAERSGNGWFETLGPPPPETPIAGEMACDWAIIGAGTCGLAVARRLGELRGQDRIAVIEADRIGFGTSGRNAGFMLNHNTHGYVKDMAVERRNARLCDAGTNDLRDLVRDHQIQCQWSEWGRIYVAADERGDVHLDELATSYDQLGHSYDIVEGAAMADMLGTSYYVRGVHAHGSALVQPAALMRGLGASLPANVTVHEDSPVTQINGGPPYTLTTTGGTITAKTLILATNVFTEELGVAPGRVVPIATFASLTAPLTPAQRAHMGSADEWGLLPANTYGSTVRLTRDGRLFMRNSLHYARTKIFDDALIAEVEANHREAIRRRWPALADIGFVGTWGGILGFTRNNGMVFGEMEDGIHAVVTADAAPFSRGTIAGKLLAEKLCGVESPLLDLMRTVPMAGRLPPEPILGLVARHRIRQIRRNGLSEL